jgi:predicted lipoprotein
MTMRCVSAALLLLLALPPAALAQAPVERLNRALTDEVVIPAYGRFAESTQALAAVVGEFCAAPTADRLAAARGAFAEAMAGWQAVQPFVFGPARATGTAAVIELFPDPRGAIGRQLGKTLAAMDPALTTPGGLAGKSVALTGFRRSSGSSMTRLRCRSRPRRPGASTPGRWRMRSRGTSSASPGRCSRTGGARVAIARRC